MALSGTPAAESLKLPSPRLSGPMSLEEAIVRRRSSRTLSGRAVTLEQLSGLLWAAQGVTDPV
ncbi:MAG: nitroreductase, partial [Candidatus Eremiobacterota bacterium]